MFANSHSIGRSQIEQWHRDRFAAGGRILRIEAIKASADGTVTVDGVITSKKLRRWKIDSLSARGTFHLRDGKIVDAKFGMRPFNPLQVW